MSHVLNFHIEFFLFDLALRLIRLLSHANQITADHNERAIFTHSMYILFECVARILITLQIHHNENSTLKFQLKVAKVWRSYLSNAIDCLGLCLEGSHDAVDSLGLFASQKVNQIDDMRADEIKDA